MAQVIFIDGFDHRLRLVDGSKGWTGGNFDCLPAYSRNVSPVGRGVSLYYTTGFNGTSTYVVPLQFVNPWLTAGQAIYINDSSPIQVWFNFWENHASSVAFSVYPLADGSVQVSFPSGSPATSAMNKVAYFKTWQYWEVSAKMNSFTGVNNVTPVPDGEVYVKIDGNLVLSATGRILSTRGSIDGTVPNPGWSGYSVKAYSAWMDDLYVAMGASAPGAPSFQGNIRIYPLTPISDSTPLQYTPSFGGTHWDILNDLGGNSDMIPYVQAVTVGNQDMYLVNASTIPDGLTILGIQTSLLTQKTDSNNAGIKMRIASAATERFSPSFAVPQALPQFFSEYVQKDPNGSILWTKAALVAAKFGSELQAS